MGDQYCVNITVLDFDKYTVVSRQNALVFREHTQKNGAKDTGFHLHWLGYERLHADMYGCGQTDR